MLRTQGMGQYICIILFTVSVKILRTRCSCILLCLPVPPRTSIPVHSVYRDCPIQWVLSILLEPRFYLACLFCIRWVDIYKMRFALLLMRCQPKQGLSCCLSKEKCKEQFLWVSGQWNLFLYTFGSSWCRGKSVRCLVDEEKTKDEGRMAWDLAYANVAWLICDRQYFMFSASLDNMHVFY